MQKAFFSNIILLVLINILIKPIYLFGIDAQVQNAVGAEQYGIYFALINFAFLFQVILDPGIQNYNSKMVSEHRDDVDHIFQKTFALKLILGLDFSIMVMLAAYFIFPKIYLTHLAYILGIQVLLSFYLYFRSHFSALGDYRKDVFFSALDKLIMILLIGYFVYFREIDITQFLQLQLISYAIANLIIMVFIRGKIRIGTNFNPEEIMTVLKKALPFALVMLLMTLYTRMDGVMLERLLNDNGREAGIYAAGYRLLDAVNMIAFLFATLLLPMFARQIHEKVSVEKLSLLALRMILLIVAIVVINCAVFGIDMLNWLYVDYTSQYYSSFLLLICSFMAIGISYVYGTLITASGELKTFNLIFVMGIVVNWCMNLYAIPRYGAVGAAFATLVTQFMVMIGQTILAYRQFDLQIQWPLIFKYVFLLGVSLTISYYLHSFSPMFWMINLTISVILSVIISILLGFIRLKWIFGMAFE